MDPDISPPPGPQVPLGPRERRRRRRGQGRSPDLEDTEEIPFVGVAGAGADAWTGGTGAYGPGPGGGTPRNRAAAGRAHRVGVYGNRAYLAGRRAAAARNSAAAADTAAAAAEAAYDALYQRCAADVTRHTFLLTGDHALTREAVEHAFHLAWERWPEVASDRDPPGWVRAAAFGYVQEPWEWLRARWRRRVRRGEEAGGDEPGREEPGAEESGGEESGGEEGCGEEADRRVFAALRALPQSYRSAVVVHDVVGLDLPDAAAELEASTLAAAGRVTHAHEALAEAVPELGALPENRRAEELRARLRRFAAAQPIRTLPPGAARRRSESRTDRQLRRYALLAAVIFLLAGVVSVIGEVQARNRATPPAPPAWLTGRSVWPPAPGHGAPPAVPLAPGPAAAPAGEQDHPSVGHVRGTSG
ncbi:hypothetical protein [Streptomyces sp. B22F1]|uniref:RNA polymerase sigma factor n=1 Tax=Streptomyces sp. B22F1 TaxID=3153566 RepID=UPI00325E08ED